MQKGAGLAGVASPGGWLPGVVTLFPSPEMPLVGGTQLFPRDVESLQPICLWASFLPRWFLVGVFHPPNYPEPQKEGPGGRGSGWVLDGKMGQGIQGSSP